MLCCCCEQEIRDLLSKDPTGRLELKENADHEVYVKDLTTIVVKSASEMDAVLQAGKKNRVTGATLMNQQSSRSHAAFTITVETSEQGLDGEAHIRVGKLNLVDLAGCVCCFTCFYLWEERANILLVDRLRTFLAPARELTCP